MEINFVFYDIIILILNDEDIPLETCNIFSDLYRKFGQNQKFNSVDSYMIFNMLGGSYDLNDKILRAMIKTTAEKHELH